ncbi:MAG: antiporter [Acidobacteria bacterium]|nr:antiporter [Acidobacteriota bacterium]
MGHTVAVPVRPDASAGSWNPEDARLWEQTGKRIAYRNLWISVPCLLCSFAIWGYWSIITVQMKNLGFPFTSAQLFTLTAVAGLAGATLRIPNSFLIAIAGGRNVIALSTAFMLVPTLGAGIALQDKATPFSTFVILAALSGVGGGNFASSMSNISFFFPKRMQGTALGINAGLGNLGVSFMQFVLPWVTTFALFGAIGGAGLALPAAVPGKAAGTLVWIQNTGLFWVPILVALSIIAWFGMTNLPVFQIGSTAIALLRVLGLTLIGFAASAVGLFLLLSLKLNMWLVLPVTIITCLLLMKTVPGTVAASLKRQFSIFRSKHNWIMTWLYIMTFGSFIGYSMAFPLLIRIVFGTLPDGQPNPNAPAPFTYAWLGPLVGSLVRPIGGWLSDKWSGAKVTQISTIVMIGAALGVAHFIRVASASSAPEQYFAPFLALFLILFCMTGIGNGSTFRMIPIIFEPAQAGPVLGWSSAVAAYGAFVIPQIMGAQLQAGKPELAFYAFAGYYVTCLAVNWWFYARKRAEIPC